MIQLTQFSPHLATTDAFADIILHNTPLIDVRAPVEFQQGAFEQAHNLPLLTNEERQQVGICYKQYGNQAAVELGHQLLDTAKRKPRIEAWENYITRHPNAMLYCFRGGMRSKIAQQWLADKGYTIPRLQGGYKALRRFLLEVLQQAPQQFTQAGIQPVVLAGRTGAGKTLLLKQLANSIDLEGLAHHRGSAFGRHASAQPTQIDFENRLARRLLQHLHRPTQHLVLEDEGRNIGALNLAQPLFEFFKSGPHIEVHSSINERIALTLDEYVLQAQNEYPNIKAWQSFMLSAFARIKKRLGGVRYQQVVTEFNAAMQQQYKTNSIEPHQAWIKTLLVEYYDPMYDYQIQKKQHKIVFSGNQTEVLDYLKNNACYNA